MPRTRKMCKWEISVGSGLVSNSKTITQSKTYKGACYKAFKKLKITPPPYNHFFQRFENVDARRI